MPRLTPCPSCSAHVFFDERSCPHCGAALRSVAGPGAVVLMSLALAGCPDNSGSTSRPEPEYGVPDTAGVPVDDSGGAVAEPEYGVPDTAGVPVDDSGGAVAEPDYGVPDSAL